MTSSSLAPVRVSLRRVNRTFGTHTVLHDVDIEIDPGQVIALLASSGSGKSTLLRLIAGLDRPTDGRIEGLGGFHRQVLHRERRPGVGAAESVAGDLLSAVPQAAALPIAAEFADVYLTWGEPPQAAADKIDKVRAEAAARGRAVRFGIRLHTISRDTSDAAWAVANEMLAELSDGTDRQSHRAACQFGIRGAATDDRAARRAGRQARDLPQSVGRGGPGPRWCRHRAGRQPPGSRQPDSANTIRLASTSSSCRATRTWKRRTGSPKVCCHCWARGDCNPHDFSSAAAYRVVGTRAW